MPGSLAIFSMQSYVSAELYAQTRGLGISPAPLPPPPSPEGRVYSPSLFFEAGTADFQESETSPYRSSVLFRFPQAILPQNAVDYLINRSYLTRCYHSLFRHGPASAPEGYEIRQGSPTECDRSILGGGIYDAYEESFFGATWVAHAHPPQRSPLPSDADLETIAEMAQSNGTGHARHVLFGFHYDQPVSIDLRAVWDPIFRGVGVLHRSSPTIARQADARIQEWWDKNGSTF